MKTTHKNLITRLLSIGLMAALTMALPNIAEARSALGGTKKITIEGWADIEGNNIAAARDAATRDAQKKAIEMTAGVHIEAMMSDKAYSKIAEDKEVFNQEIISKIYSKTDGFIRNFKVIKEGRDGSVFKVTLQIEIDDTALNRELSIIGKQMAGARFPKLMFVVSETYTNKAGKSINVTESTLQSLLEDALLAKGFDLVAQDHIEKIRSQESDVFSDILTDDNKAAKFAMEYGAEYLVRAIAKVKYTSFNDLGQDEHHGFGELTLSAINASSAAIVASKKESGNSPANCFSEDELKIKAVSHLAPKLVDNLVTRILESWERETQNGIRYSVKLYNVKSYRKQGRKFLKLVEKIAEVVGVKKLSYGGNRLEIEVFYPMAYDVSHLEDAIMDAIDGTRMFRKLDVTFSRGRELNFKM